MLHAGSAASMNSSGLQSAYHHPPKASTSRSHSPSTSTSSAVVVNRTASPTTGHRLDPYNSLARDQAALSTADETLLAVKLPISAFSRSTSPNATYTPDPQINDGVGNLNRWSQSTTSSVGIDSPERNRTYSAGGAGGSSIWDRRNLSASQPPSPHREELSPRSTSKQTDASLMRTSDQHRRNAPSLDKPLPPAIPPLSSLHIPMTSVVSPNEFDLLLTANTYTPSSSGLLTPLSYSAFDYFGSGATVGASSKREPPPPPPPTKHIHQTSPASRHNHIQNTSSASQSSTGQSPYHHQTSSVEEGSSTDHSQRPTKHRRDRREKDKKTMLSKALEKANTAVQLDNAMNYEGALEAYQDACRLLEFVMDRTTGPDDRRKLDTIRDTYTIRIDELLQMQIHTRTAGEQKRLPPRPMSGESFEYSPTFKTDEAVSGQRDSAVIETATLTRIIDAPQAPLNPRHSFLTDAIREVEGSSSEGFLGPLWERSKSPFRESTFSDRTARVEDQLEGTYLPRPLTPRLIPSAESRDDQEEDRPDPAPVPVAELAGDHSPTADAPVSWLDTIEESGSDSSSVHSHSSQRSVHRKDLHTAIDETEIDFDTAFDAAVEAAYEDGYVPDPDALGDTPRSQSLHLEVPPPAEEYDFPTDTEDDMEAEEERILDDITKDYTDYGFDFDMQSKSALPRQSDSSVFSRDTWQSSVVSNRTTAGTSLSTVAKGIPDDVRPESQSMASGLDLAQSSAVPLEITFGQSSARPLSVISEGSRSVQDRRFTGTNFKNLKIETATKPLETWARTALPMINDELAKNEDEEALDETEDVNRPISEVPSLHRFEKTMLSPRKVHSAASEDSLGPPDSADTMSTARSPRPRMFRKNKSSISLRDHSMLISEEHSERSPLTPLSAGFGSSFVLNDNGLATARRPHPYITPSAGSYPALRDGLVSTTNLFDTSLGAMSQPSTPQSADLTPPSPLEPCPESTLLRPFWLLRNIASTISHPRGGYLTNRLFVPREIWQTRNVKLRNIDDKIANCDLLSAALGKLSNVDTYDADAVLDELQSFEEVMERVQTTLVKKLGSEVGVQSAGASFKDATTTVDHGAVSSEGRDAPKTNSGKSYLTSWRKLRNKNSGFGTAGSATSGIRNDGVTMASVPMTGFVSVDRRPANKWELTQENGFEGPLKEYMYSLVRLCEAAQVLDQVARQVEDPGLKHSSSTYVGLELITRHAAEFFGFYICRFALADIGTLLDKFVKRSSEWVMS